jgi:hypothetical protein
MTRNKILESLENARDAAWYAAWDTIRSASWSATRSAASSAAQFAAWDAAESADYAGKKLNHKKITLNLI